MADALRDAQQYYNESLDALRDQRRQIEEDLRFSDPSNPDQWDTEVRLKRESDPGGKRPCLVHDQLSQYTAQVTGQIEKQPPSLHAIPVGDGAEKDAAEQIDGRFRHIEHASRAAQHYARAMTSAARAGVGYLIIRPDYVDRALNWQEPRIGCEPDPLKVVFDPWSVDMDGADANVGWILTSMGLREFERRWPKKTARDFGDLQSAQSRDDRNHVLVAEEWLRVWKTATKTIYRGADGAEVTADISAAEFDQQRQIIEQMSGDRLEFLREFTDKAATIQWRRMSGEDILEESEYPADWIGIVPMYGYVGFSNGRMRYCGVPRRGMMPQRAYNYHISEQQAYIGTAPKSPWWVSKRAAAGVEDILDNLAVQSRAWVPYNDIDHEGPISQPMRISPAVNLGNHIEGAAQALRDIQAAVGMYQANLGAPSNETSGVAIESRKQQGESSTAHFPSHMAASLGQVGQIVMQMDGRLLDKKRKAPILGIDGTPGSVTVDPEQKQAFQRGPGGVSINPTVGKYGVRVVVGASYSTQRAQTNAAFAEIMRSNKELAQTVAPFWAQTLDFPGSDKFAQAMAAMAPPPVKAIIQPEGADKGPDPAAMAQQLAQMQQALQEAIQHAHDAQEDADRAIADQADAKRIAEVRERELDIQAYNAETARLKVTGANVDQTAAVVRDLITEMLNQPTPLPGETEAEPGPDAWQAHMPMDDGMAGMMGNDGGEMPQDAMQGPDPAEGVMP